MPDEPTSGASRSPESTPDAPPPSQDKRPDDRWKSLVRWLRRMPGLTKAFALLLTGFLLKLAFDQLAERTNWGTLTTALVAGLLLAVILFLLLKLQSWTMSHLQLSDEASLGDDGSDSSGTLPPMPPWLGHAWKQLHGWLGLYSTAVRDWSGIQHAQACRVFCSVLRAALSTIIILAIGGLITLLTTLTTVLVGVSQVQKLTEQNKLIETQNEISALQQEFELGLRNADSAYEEIRDNLLKPDASPEQQVFALRQVPEAMTIPLAQITLADQGRSDVPKRIIKKLIYPNAARLRELLKFHARDDRVGRLLRARGIISGPDDPLPGEAIEALEVLEPVSTQIFLTLDAMGPAQPGDAPDSQPSLWNWDGASPPPPVRPPLWSEFIYMSRKGKPEIDLRHLRLSGALDGIQAPHAFTGSIKPRFNSSVFRLRLPEGENVIYAHLEGAFLAHASMPGVSFIGTRLDGADLSEADLFGATISGSWLAFAKCDGMQAACSTITGSHFPGASFNAVVMPGGNVTLSTFEEVRMPECDFTGSSWNRCGLQAAVLTGVKFRGSTLQNMQVGRWTPEPVTSSTNHLPLLESISCPPAMMATLDLSDVTLERISLDPRAIASREDAAKFRQDVLKLKSDGMAIPRVIQFVADECPTFFNKLSSHPFMREDRTVLERLFPGKVQSDVLMRTDVTEFTDKTATAKDAAAWVDEVSRSALLSALSHHKTDGVSGREHLAARQETIFQEQLRLVPSQRSGPVWEEFQKDWEWDLKVELAKGRRVAAVQNALMRATEATRSLPAGGASR